MAGAQNGGKLPNLSDADWLAKSETQAVLAALTVEGAEARAVGGAVRNALMGAPVKDIDIATTAVPTEVMRLAKQAGLHAVPTGLEHGTVTVVAEHTPFEVTTLRKDIETFGRHAKVTFSTDWREDALRRDFTMNALYCSADGTVHDPLGGYPDLVARKVRFIGDPHQRIREDYLRILRFFRFSAEYADGIPDAEGLTAAIEEKDGLSGLSGERVRAELLQLLAAPGSIPAVGKMIEADLLATWLARQPNVSRLERLTLLEEALGRPADPVLRLAALAVDTPENSVQLQEKLRLSAAETERLRQASVRDPAFGPSSDERSAQAFIYRQGPSAFVDGALLDWARSSDDVTDAARMRRLTLPERWQAPVLPVRGADVLKLGVAPGPDVGRVIAAFEDWWIGEGYPSDQAVVEAKLAELVRTVDR